MVVVLVFEPSTTRQFQEGSVRNCQVAQQGGVQMFIRAASLGMSRPEAVTDRWLRNE